jgi:hypothetical protein
MKTLSTTLCYILIAGIAFCQRNGGYSNNSTNGYSSTTNSNSNAGSNNAGSNNGWGALLQLIPALIQSFSTDPYSTPDVSTYSNKNLRNNSYINEVNSNDDNNYNRDSYGNGYRGTNGYNRHYNSYYNLDSDKPSFQTHNENFGETIILGDHHRFIPTYNPYNTTKMMSNYRNDTAIEKFFQQNQKPSQVFIVNAQLECRLTGAGGTIVKIAPNSFVDENGEVVKGEVQVEMKEMYTKSDMILSNAHTVCYNAPLKSGGEIFLGASRNGEPLILANDKPISVEVPATSAETMQLFNGKPDGNTIDWDLASPVEIIPVINSNSSTGFSYNFISPNMNWLNCDRFVSSRNPSDISYYTPTTKVNVRLLNIYDSTNTAVFIVYDKQNTVTKFDGFYKYDGSTKLLPDQNGFNTEFYSVQEGSDVTIVAIAVIDGRYYSSMEQTRIQKDHVSDLMMSPTNLDRLKLDLENLQ